MSDEPESTDEQPAPPSADDTVGTGRLRLTEAEQQLLASSWNHLMQDRYRSLRVGAAAEYRVLPAHLAESDLALPLWRIELNCLTVEAAPLGLDICGDVVLGRGKEDDVQGPHLDLGVFGAGDLGVSRRHALLRPSRNRLNLIDLGSKNGTRYNTIRLGQGEAHALQSQDTIAFGKLTFEVKIIHSPLMGHVQETEGPLKKARDVYLGRMR